MHYNFLLDIQACCCGKYSYDDVMTRYRCGNIVGQSHSCIEPVPLNCDFHKSLHSPLVGQVACSRLHLCRGVFSSSKVERLVSSSLPWVRL